MNSGSRALRYALRERLWQAFTGWIYRADIGHMSHALGGHEDATVRVLDALKTAVDPDNIVLPGRFLTPRGART